MVLGLSIASLVGVAFASGAAIFVIRRIHLHNERIRIPLQQRIEQQQEKLQNIQCTRAAHDLFLAGLSHELRTPLSGIQGAVQLLQNSDLTGPQQEYARMISYASTTVLEIVDDMLTYSRMQTGHIKTESVSFSVRQMIDDMLSLQSIKAQRRGIALISDVASDVPDILCGDRGKLNQVLLNLIGNAIKFTEEGSVTVSAGLVSSPPVASSTLQLRFAVRDTGVGMTPDELQRVFEPFVQGHAAQRDGRQGTGLGLTICQKLLHAMDAEIRIDSVLDQGCCVEFELPLQRVIQPGVHPSDQTEAQTPTTSLVVLVVEDDDINRLVCTRYLALAGHHPVTVADERQMQHVMTFSSRVPDVVLMDVNLAGYSGVELAARMRKRDAGRWQNVPVIAMSADNSGIAQEQAWAGGIPFFLAKPFSAGQLYEAMGRAVQASDTDTEPGEAPAASAGFSTPVDASPALSDQIWLDKAWLKDETETLGVSVMFELLNLFRSSAANTFKALGDAAQRQDWDATADLLHHFQGSAANLGMQYLVQHAKALQSSMRVEGGPHPAYMDAKITKLEATCHASADALRAWLLDRAQGVAFPAQGDD